MIPVANTNIVSLNEDDVSLVVRKNGNMEIFLCTSDMHKKYNQDEPFPMLMALLCAMQNPDFIKAALDCLKADLIDMKFIDDE